MSICLQSTNDAYPTSFKLAFIFMNEELVADLKLLIQAFGLKEKSLKEVLKMGRTQLQDAVPMTMGTGIQTLLCKPGGRSRPAEPDG